MHTSVCVSLRHKIRENAQAVGSVMFYGVRVGNSWFYSSLEEILPGSLSKFPYRISKKHHELCNYSDVLTLKGKSGIFLIYLGSYTHSYLVLGPSLWGLRSTCAPPCT